MRRRYRATLVGTVLVLAAALTVPATATPAVAIDQVAVVQEHLEDGTPAESPLQQVGTSSLARRADGLHARVHVEGLRPGGVYTFWWVVVQDDGTFPDDIFVALGAGTVAGRNGRASVRMSAALGQPGIGGFEPAPGVVIEWDTLRDPLGSLVRVEIAYHGQAADAGDDLETWLSDFWTGAACPPATSNPNPAQPHCPVYYAASHG